MALVLLFSNLANMNTNAVVVLSLFIGSAVIVTLCFKQLKGVTKVIGKGVDNGICGRGCGGDYFVLKVFGVFAA